MRDVASYNSGTDTTSIVNHLKYDSFGQILSQTNSSYQSFHTYTGREWDADTNLFYYRARWYDAVSGRFIGEDPIGFFGHDTNLNRFVVNSPTRSSDPSGLTSLLDPRAQIVMAEAMGNGVAAATATTATAAPVLTAMPTYMVTATASAALPATATTVTVATAGMAPAAASTVATVTTAGVTISGSTATAVTVETIIVGSGVTVASIGVGVPTATEIAVIGSLNITQPLLGTVGINVLPATATMAENWIWIDQIIATGASVLMNPGGGGTATEVAAFMAAWYVQVGTWLFPPF